jgi:hypothetical protein
MYSRARALSIKKIDIFNGKAEGRGMEEKGRLGLLPGAMLEGTATAEIASAYRLMSRNGRSPSKPRPKDRVWLWARCVAGFGFSNSIHPGTPSLWT